MGRVVLSAVGLVAYGSCATARDDHSIDFTSIAQRSFASGGSNILVDVYTPTMAGRHQPILVLHGAGGMLFDGPEMSRVAGALATAGYEVYQVHYFDRTKTWFARQAVLLKLFPIWLDTVHDAAEWVRSLHPESPAIGIFGYSLGAFAAIEEARRNPAVGTVVEQAGGFWHAHPEGPTRQPMPPMLVIHGRDDQRVPFEKYAQPLLDFLCAHHDPFEQRLYPGEGHQFSSAASAQVRQQAVHFFATHLPRQPPKASKLALAEKLFVTPRQPGRCSRQFAAALLSFSRDLTRLSGRLLRKPRPGPSH